MIKLLIVLCVLASGKIADQQSVVPQIVNTQPLPVLSPTSRDFNRRFIGPPSLQRFQNSVRLSNQFLINNGSDSSNLPPVSTVRENQPRRQLFIPRRVAERMNGNQPLVRESNTRRDNGNSDVRDFNVVRNSGDMHGHVNYEEDKKATTGSDKTTTTPSAPPISVVQLGGATPKPSAVPDSNELNITGVTFDHRSSFDGNKCPTGLIRINGSNDCIQPD